MSIVDALSVLGSPPLTRETLDHHLRSRTFPRITPAYAGNTRQIGRNVPCREDHPRLRGKHKPYSIQILRKVGSPPLTRETQPLAQSGKVQNRITPAYAGNTIRPDQRHDYNWDHPRLRGKHRAEFLSSRWTIGSPPLTRETHCCKRLNRADWRITPAYAGNT